MSTLAIWAPATAGGNRSGERLSRPIDAVVEAAGQPGRHEAAAGPEGPDGHVADPRGPGEGDDDQPDVRRVQCAVGSDVPVGQQREDHEGDHQELDGIVDLDVGDDIPCECVDPDLAGQEDQEGDGHGGSQPGVRHAECAEEEHCERGELGGGPRVAAVGAAVAGNDQAADHHRPGDKRPGPEERGQRPDGGQQREGPRPQRLAGAAPVAPLALDPDEQADGDRVDECKSLRRGHEVRPLVRTARAAASVAMSMDLHLRFTGPGGPRRNGSRVLPGRRPAGPRAQPGSCACREPHPSR